LGGRVLGALVVLGEIQEEERDVLCIAFLVDLSVKLSGE
jgi:hypothetical protein